MKFKTYFEAVAAQPPKYLWNKSLVQKQPNDSTDIIYKLVGHRRGPGWAPLYKLNMHKINGKWQDIKWTTMEVTELYLKDLFPKDEFIEIADDAELEREMTLDGI